MCILCCDILVKMLMFSSQEAQELHDVECNTANIHIMSLITGYSFLITSTHARNKIENNCERAAPSLVNFSVWMPAASSTT